MFEQYRFKGIYKELGKLVVQACRHELPSTHFDAALDRYFIRRNNLVFVVCSPDITNISWALVYLDTKDRSLSEWRKASVGSRSWLNNDFFASKGTQVCISSDNDAKLTPAYKRCVPQVYKLTLITMNELREELNAFDPTPVVNPVELLSSILDMKQCKGETK